MMKVIKTNISINNECINYKAGKVEKESGLL